jgi:hypothetical protein
MLILPDTSNPTMVHKIPTHARKMLNTRNFEFPQLILLANPRLHQHFRRVQRTQGQDHFTSSTNAMNFSLVEDLHTCRFLVRALVVIAVLTISLLGLSARLPAARR